MLTNSISFEQLGPGIGYFLITWRNTTSPEMSEVLYKCTNHSKCDICQNCFKAKEYNHSYRMDASTKTFWTGKFSIEEVPCLFLWTPCFIEIPIFNAKWALIAWWIGELTLNPSGFSPLWFEPRSGPIWESQVLLMDGQVVFFPGSLVFDHLW